MVAFPRGFRETLTHSFGESAAAGVSEGPGRPGHCPLSSPQGLQGLCKHFPSLSCFYWLCFRWGRMSFLINLMVVLWFSSGLNSGVSHAELTLHARCVTSHYLFPNWVPSSPEGTGWEKEILDGRP